MTELLSVHIDGKDYEPTEEMKVIANRIEHARYRMQDAISALYDASKDLRNETKHIPTLSAYRLFLDTAQDFLDTMDGEIKELFEDDFRYDPKTVEMGLYTEIADDDAENE